MVDFSEEIIYFPIYFDSLEEIEMLREEVDGLDEDSLIDELGQINLEINDQGLKDILKKHKDNISLCEDDIIYLKNLYVTFYTEVGIDFEDGQFIYEPIVKDEKERW